MRILLQSIESAFEQLAKDNPKARLVRTKENIWAFQKGWWLSIVTTRQDGIHLVAQPGERVFATTTQCLHDMHVDVGGLLEDTQTTRCEDAPCCGCCL